MLFSLTKGEEPPFYLISGNEYSIGRKQNSVDICLEDDKSISRLHARIKVGPNNAFVIDNGSKYGTSHQGKPLSAKAEVLLEDNDIIKFGVFESVFRFQKVKIVTSTSGLEQTITDDLKPTFLFLGAQLTKVWSDNCTHLTVQTIVLTFKILLALIDNKPIVTPQYWSKIAESVRNRQQGPSLKLFKPPIAELLLENELDICYNEKRSTLFLGKVLVFPTNKLMERVKEIVLKTGGSCISWEENQLTVPEIFNGFDKYIFIQMEGEKEGPTFKEAVEYLKQINQRAIPMAEFGMAVLLSCCDKDCNPNFDRMGQVFGKHTQSGDRHTANITLAPETQSQMNPSIESLKQEIEIPATLESDIGDLPEHLPSTSSGFKRPPEKDCLNFNPVKKTKVERKEEESSLRKRKCDDSLETSNQVKNPFFSMKRTNSTERNNPFKEFMASKNKPLNDKTNTLVGNPFAASTSKSLLDDDHPFGEFMAQDKSKTDHNEDVKVAISSSNISEVDGASRDKNNCSLIPDQSSVSSSVSNEDGWLSKDTILDDTSSEVSIIPDHLKEFCSQFKNSIKVNHVPVEDLLRKDLPRDSDGKIDLFGNIHIKNFKKFKKVAPRYPQSKIINFSKSHVCSAAGGLSRISRLCNSDDDSDDDRPRKGFGFQKAAKAKPSKSRFDF